MLMIVIASHYILALPQDSQFKNDSLVFQWQAIAASKDSPGDSTTINSQSSNLVTIEPAASEEVEAEIEPQEKKVLITSPPEKDQEEEEEEEEEDLSQFLTDVKFHQPHKQDAKNTRQIVIAPEAWELTKDNAPKKVVAVEISSDSSKNTDYINPPVKVANEKINPFTTTIPINDLSISHLTNWEIGMGYALGSQTANDPDFNGILKINSEVIQSLRKDKVFTVEQKGEYVQLRTVTDYRKITTTQTTPVTIIGQRLQISLTGDCIFTDAPKGSICTYTPGLATDESSIDAKTLLPTRIETTSNFGDIVTPESLTEMAKPGFQSGANGQQLGLNLFFPNSGVVNGNSQSSNGTLTRKEELKNAMAASYLYTHQVIQANNKKAVIARTVRGLPLIQDEKNTLLNPALSIFNLFLPDLNPNLEGSDPTQQSNSSANRNLFFAVNNTRLPPLSFVIYQAGLGEAPNTPKGVTNLSQIPAAFFNSIWLGLSPVIDRRTDVLQGGYDIIRPIQVVEKGGKEGGSTENVDFSSVVNNNSFSNKNLTSPYVQVALTSYDQEANVVIQNIYDEETHYYPHLSFTGNITDSSSVLRYYAGVIAASEIKPYIGLDYSKNYDTWNYRLGAVGYANPDRDYYSQLNGFINYRIPLQADTLLSVYSSIEYALQNYTRVGDTFSVVPLSSFSMGLRVNGPGINLGLTNFWGLDNLANNSNSKMLINFGLDLSQDLSLNGYVAPYDSSSSKTQYGLKLNLNLGRDYNTPQLSLGWANYQYNYGLDLLGNSSSLSDNVFTLTFRIGQPNNPFRKPPTPQ
jgi:hypothetical protein